MTQDPTDKAREPEDILHDLLVVASGIVKVPYGTGGQKAKAIKELKDWRDKAEKRAYKKGYVDRGVEDIVATEKARKEVEKQLEGDS